MTHPDTLDIPGDPTPWVIVESNDNKEFCVLWLQGWGSAIKDHLELIERLSSKSGVAFAMVEYAGHGSHPISLENSTREMQFNEVLAAYDELKNRGYQHIIVAGTSFGSYMTALLSAARDPYGVILRVPAIYRDDEFSMSYDLRSSRDADYQEFKKTVTSESRLAALDAIRKFNEPVYVIEQEVDSIIPKNIPRSYFEVAKHGNYLVVPATDHAPVALPELAKNYAYIEHLITSTIHALTLEKVIRN